MKLFMKAKAIRNTLFTSLLLLSVCTLSAQQSVVPEGFTSLFNGKDFTGWDIQPDKGAWKVENGMIHCYGKPNDPYFIISEKEYENFELYVDFRMSPKCNSGITIHLVDRDHGRESRMGMEIQVGDDAGRPVGVHSCGAIYDVIPPKVNAVRPAHHWNTYHIVMDWPVLLIELNGQVVQNENLENHPNLRYRLRKGHIGLQNHGKEVDYRNISIRELPSKEPQWTSLFNGKDLAGWETAGDAKWTVENGVIVASGGSGYLISKETFRPDYELQVYASKDSAGMGSSGVFYHWENETERGRKAEFYDETSTVKLKYMDYRFLPLQIINLGKESTVILNGIEVQKNSYHLLPPQGRIAIYHAANDRQVKIERIRIKNF
jgi:hypothetical protein